MKQISKKTFPLFVISIYCFVIGCNGGESTSTISDTAPAPMADSIPGVVRPAPMDTAGVIKPPGTNDDNVILPDSAH
ncbi:MAG: hypothetical protein JWQ96_1384 [Segetibacter sp.]|nr:hypothetical protein [Segetibacter sp.]